MHEQICFLKKMGLPSSGLEEKMHDYSRDYKSLDEKYEKELVNIHDESSKKIYRQVVSQMLLKHININSNFYQSDSVSDRKIKFYLSETKNSDGVNIELIYSSLLKIYKNRTSRDACNTIALYSSYATNVAKRRNAELREMYKEKNLDLDPLDRFIYDDLKKRLEQNFIILNDIHLLENKYCK